MVSVCTVPARGGRSCECFGGYKTINQIPRCCQVKIYVICQLQYSAFIYLIFDFIMYASFNTQVLFIIFVTLFQIARMISKYHLEQQQKELRAEKEEGMRLKRIASSMSKMVKEFWNNIEKVQLVV